MVLQLIETGEARLANPEAFYPNIQGRKNSLITPKKLPYNTQKIGRSNNKEERDGKEEIEDIPLGYISSISKEERTTEESIRSSQNTNNETLLFAALPCEGSSNNKFLTLPEASWLAKKEICRGL